jgi:hypothetical protein
MVAGNESTDDGIEEIKRDANENAGNYFFHVVVQTMVKKNDAINEESHHSVSHLQDDFFEFPGCLHCPLGHKMCTAKIRNCVA